MAQSYLKYGLAFLLLLISTTLFVAIHNQDKTSLKIEEKLKKKYIWNVDGYNLALIVIFLAFYYMQDIFSFHLLNFENFD